MIAVDKGKKRMLMGGWILAALLVLAYNASGLSSLLDPPLTGYSNTVKSVIQKRYELATRITTAQNAAPPMDLAAITAKVDRKPEIVEMEKKPEPPKKQVPALIPTPAKEKITELPRLQGIFRISNGHGASKPYALLEGKILAETDRIGKFTLKKISEEGVALTKGSESWFLSRPDIPFCLSREE